MLPELSNIFPWWTTLGLQEIFQDVPDEDHSPSFGKDLLAQYQPVGFVGPDGTQISLKEMAKVLRDAQAAEHKEYLAQLDAERERQRKLGWEKVEQALAAADAAEPITSGVWAGLSRGQAFAWAWTLAQYVPSRGSHPAVLMHQHNLKGLKLGKLIEYAHYAAIAKRCESEGMDVRAYRRAREALGDKPHPIG